MISINREVYVDIDIDVIDIIHGLNSLSTYELLELKSAIDRQMSRSTKYQESPLGVILSETNRTIENSEKVEYLVDNIWDISLNDLENITN